MLKITIITNKKNLWLFILPFVFAVVFFLMASPSNVRAASPPPTIGNAFTEVQPVLEIPVPGLPKFTPIVQSNDKDFLFVSYIGQYIAAMYSYLVGIAGILAISMIMYQGIKWIFAAGDSAKIGEAKEGINRAVIGLVLALGSYLILFTLNPDLVTFKSLQLMFIPQNLLESIRAGGEIRLDAKGQDDAQNYRVQSCDGLATNGQSFDAYFTTYFKPVYNDNSGYDKAFVLTDPKNKSSGTIPDPNSNSGFLCAVAMECTCPVGRDDTKRCYSGAGKWSRTFAGADARYGWAPCKPFPATTPFCGGSSAGILSPGLTVAADKDCFSVSTGSCRIQVDGTQIMSITDTGSGIRGKRFDVWIGTNGNAVGPKSGVHQVKVIPGSCNQPAPYRGGKP